MVQRSIGHGGSRPRLEHSIKPPPVVGDKFARGLKRLLALVVLCAPAAYAADSFFEQELAHSALEQLKERGIHNDLLTAYLYDFSVDKALSIEEMPINLPMNGQGQGFINTAFLIKELIVDDTTRRGPYYAEDGDFAGAGALQLFYLQRPGQHQLTLGLGEEQHRMLETNVHAAQLTDPLTA